MGRNTRQHYNYIQQVAAHFRNSTEGDNADDSTILARWRHGTIKPHNLQISARK